MHGKETLVVMLWLCLYDTVLASHHSGTLAMHVQLLVTVQAYPMATSDLLLLLLL
jgi:hypothetical protein